MAGGCTVSVDDGTTRTPIRLSPGAEALYLPPLLRPWLDLGELTEDAVCCVLASDLYDEAGRPRHPDRQSLALAPRAAGALMAPGGVLIAVTPNIESLVHRWFNADWRGLEPPRHLHLLSPRTLRTVAQAFRALESRNTEPENTTQTDPAPVGGTDPTQVESGQRRRVRLDRGCGCRAAPYRLPSQSRRGEGVRATTPCVPSIRRRQASTTN